LYHGIVETNVFKEDEPQYNNCKVMNFPVSTNNTSEIIHYAIKGLISNSNRVINTKKPG